MTPSTASGVDRLLVTSRSSVQARLQARHGLAIDLGERAVMRFAEGAAVGGPVAAVGFVAERGVVDRGRRAIAFAGEQQQANHTGIPLRRMRRPSFNWPANARDFSTIAALNSTQTEAGLAFRDTGLARAVVLSLTNSWRDGPCASSVTTNSRTLTPAEKHDTASPVPTQVVSNGEFTPLPQSEDQARVEARIGALADELAPKHGHEPPRIPVLRRRHVGRIPGH